MLRSVILTFVRMTGGGSITAFTRGHSKLG